MRIVTNFPTTLMPLTAEELSAHVQTFVQLLRLHDANSVAGATLAGSVDAAHAVHNHVCFNFRHCAIL